MYSEDDLIHLSALQHYVFCPRQCALIYIEQVWNDNRLTAEGKILHDKVHEAGSESRGKVRIEHAVPLRSLRLGLVGIADVVEFHQQFDGTWKPFPVEYKRGKPKPDDCDKIQLCAQAICLEEMLKTEVSEGALFYGKTRHRFDVTFNPWLREKTEKTANFVHELVASGMTPNADYARKCDNCSMISYCLPKISRKRFCVNNYLKEITRESEKAS